jgi:hypothetical protein
MREPKLGEYFYRPRMNDWVVYRWSFVGEYGAASAEFVARFGTKIEARRFVYEKNGWN